MYIWPISSPHETVLQVDEAWRRLVQPFVAANPRRFQQRRRADPNAYELFTWAVAVVAAYSFELGDEKFQVAI